MAQSKMRKEMIDAFLNALQEDKIPWHKSWSTLQSMPPRNAVKGTEYRGVNRFWLFHTAEQKGYSDPRWCTFKQAKDNGWHVKKGEKGTHVEFWSLYDQEAKRTINDEEAYTLRQQLSQEEYAERVKPVANNYTVFNAEQIEGIQKLPELTVETYELDEDEIIRTRAVLLENMNVLFQEGGEKAFYRPSEDCIHLPEIRRFESEYDYMATLLHEAGHATGHESRLRRPMLNVFGTPDYAKEELRAEIASAFTAQTLHLSQSGSHMDNHKAYIQSWIKILKNEPDELFRAIKDAEKISDYLIEKGKFTEHSKEKEIPLQKEASMDKLAKEETPSGESENDFSLPDSAAEPTVTIIWSEHSRFHDGETMSLSEANALIENLDRATVSEDGYYKTEFRIDFVMDGQPDNYIGRQDLGDGDGTLIEHIESYHAYYENNEEWNNYVLRNEGKEALEADKAQREMLLHEFVPYLKLHNNLSQMEQLAAKAMEEKSSMTAAETAFHIAMQEYVSKCRAMVNSGDYNLPPVPQFKDFDMELAAYKEHVKEEIAQEAAAAGMTVEEYATNGYQPYSGVHGEGREDLIHELVQLERDTFVPMEDRNSDTLQEMTEEQLNEQIAFLKQYRIPVMSFQEMTKLRMDVKRELSDNFDYYTSLSASKKDILGVMEWIELYRKQGIPDEEIILSHLDEIHSRCGHDSYDYTKNLVCSVCSRDRGEYYKRISLADSMEHERQMQKQVSSLSEELDQIERQRINERSIENGKTR